MNPLTIAARRDRKAERRTDTLLAVACSVVFSALVLAFFI